MLNTCRCRQNYLKLLLSCKKEGIVSRHQRSFSRPDSWLKCASGNRFQRTYAFVRNSDTFPEINMEVELLHFGDLGLIVHFHVYCRKSRGRGFGDIGFWATFHPLRMVVFVGREILGIVPLAMLKNHMNLPSIMGWPAWKTACFAESALRSWPWIQATGKQPKMGASEAFQYEIAFKKTGGFGCKPVVWVETIATSNDLELSKYIYIYIFY